MAEQGTLPVPFGMAIVEKIEATAVAAARDILTGRRILEVEGPYGLGLTTIEVGNDDLCRQPGPKEASAVGDRCRRSTQRLGCVFSLYLHDCRRIPTFVARIS
ncbi:MAG TPA: encapsulin [Candidatus Binatia bacterium]|jgi:uncharacterized linocin/CFP29 family protein|nr:encapsulin [Candidatus Binatia bacterium]